MSRDVLIPPLIEIDGGGASSVGVPATSPKVEDDSVLDDAWLERMKEEHPEEYHDWWWSDDVQEHVRTQPTGRPDPASLRRFYDLITPKSKREAQPVLNLRWAQEMAEEFPEACEIWDAREAEPVLKKLRNEEQKLRQQLAEAIKMGYGGLSAPQKPEPVTLPAAQQDDTVTGGISEVREIDPDVYDQVIDDNQDNIETDIAPPPPDFVKEMEERKRQEQDRPKDSAAAKILGITGDDEED